jgi:hypothetical protein
MQYADPSVSEDVPNPQNTGTSYVPLEPDPTILTEGCNLVLILRVLLLPALKFRRWTKLRFGAGCFGLMDTGLHWELHSRLSVCPSVRPSGHIAQPTKWQIFTNGTWDECFLCPPMQTVSWPSHYILINTALIFTVTVLYQHVSCNHKILIDAMFAVLDTQYTFHLPSCHIHILSPHTIPSPSPHRSITHPTN